jgi:hypothetical protein
MDDFSREAPTSHLTHNERSTQKSVEMDDVMVWVMSFSLAIII